MSVYGSVANCEGVRKKHVDYTQKERIAVAEQLVWTLAAYLRAGPVLRTFNVEPAHAVRRLTKNNERKRQN